MQEKMSSGVVRKRSKRGKKKKNKIVQDNRFQKVHSDPRFARLPPQQNKVKVDERFSGGNSARCTVVFFRTRLVS